MNRRDFLKATGGAAAFLKLASRQAYAFSVSMPLSKFSQTLRGVADIPILSPDANSLPANPAHPDPLLRNGVNHYTIEVSQFTDQLHPSHTNGTKLWGYSAPGGPKKHLGGLIIAERNKPSQLSFTNTLPSTHIIPIDTSPLLFFDGAIRKNAIAIHLHGGFVPWISDGGPYDWWTPGKAYTGASFKNNLPTYPCTPTGEAEYWYPNQESARLLWYHDHAHDITRINAYAGLATGYIVRDTPKETAMDLPLAEAGGREIPLVFQDKTFKNGNPQAVRAFPQYELPVGDLWYPYIYDRSRWTLNSRRLPPVPSCVPEAFGDTPLVNGTVYPVLTVDPTWYRFRILNACNARFMNLQLIQWAGPTGGSGITWDGLGYPSNSPGPHMIQIGTEAGFLPGAVDHQGYNSATNGTGTVMIAVTDPNNGNLTAYQHNLLMAPAERADLLIDFTASAGQTLILYTDAGAPFPSGDPAYDFVSATNMGPDTRTLMKIVVNSTIQSGQPVFNGATAVAALSQGALEPAVLVSQTPGTPTAIPGGATVRDLALFEGFDPYGRLIQMVGTPATTGIGYAELATEYLDAGATEVWRFANTTGDTHPMHFHLINAQILSRQVFNVAAFTTPGSGSYGDITGSLVGSPWAPDNNELGWKETIRMNPGEVVTFIAKFDMPQVPFTIPSSTRPGVQVPLGGKTTLNEYVYHCHILEHEEHDMMRPLVVRS